NYVRVFSEIHDAKIVLVCDANEERLRAVRERYPLVATSPNWEEAITSRWVDAVVIATPANSHFEIAERCLQSGKHVLVEKPIATRVDHAERLVQLAEETGVVLMVGHTFLYNAGIRKVKELMASASFGKAYYLHATRTNMRPIRGDVNAMWDLG